MPAFSFGLWNLRGAKGRKGDRRWVELRNSRLMNDTVIFLQECHVNKPRQLDASAPTNDRLGAFEIAGFSGYLTNDCGVLFQPKTWKIKNIIHRPTYLILEVTGPAPMLPQLDKDKEKPVDTIFLISHHFPCKEGTAKGWDGDKNPFSHVPEDAVVIIGADWNMMSSMAIDGVNYVDRDEVGLRGRHITAEMKETMHNYGLDDWYRLWDEEGREITRLANYDALAHSETNGLTTGRRLDSIWGPAGLVNLIENIEFTPTNSDHRMVRYCMQTPLQFDFSREDLGIGASLWRLHPGVLANPQFQAYLVDWAQMYMQTEQPTDPVLRWERFHEELQHRAYSFGLPVGRRHKKAALQARDLSDKMSDDNLFEDHGLHAEGIKKLIYSYNALADMAAMGWAGSARRIAFSAFSPTGWAADKATQVSAIVNCLFDAAGKEVRNLFEVSQVAQRYYNRLFGSPRSNADATTTAAPHPPAGAPIAAATAEATPLASSPEAASSSDTITAETAARERLDGTRSAVSSSTLGAFSAAAVQRSGGTDSSVVSDILGAPFVPTSCSTLGATSAAAAAAAQPGQRGGEMIAPTATHALGATSTLLRPFPPFPPSATPVGSSSSTAATRAAVTHARRLRNLKRLESNAKSQARDFAAAVAAVSDELEADLTDEDIGASLGAEKAGAAAGPDGLPATVYWLVRGACVPLLRDLANALMAGASLGEDDATCRGVLKHKGGDKRDCSNYRPVTIPSFPRKIISRALGQRLSSKLQDFSSPLQQAYIKKGRREVSIGMLQMVLTRIREGKEPSALMVLLDFEKAFDRVDRAFLLQTMEHYGFGPKIRSFVKGLYDNAHLFFSVNRWNTELIKMERGLFQGDPASPMLFLISMQPLYDALEAKGAGLTLGGGRDDVGENEVEGQSEGKGKGKEKEEEQK